MHELARLIQSRKGDSSYDDLARRTGGEVSRQYFARIGKGTTPLRELPKPETLIALARALGVSVDLVAVAALRSAGVRVRDRFGAVGAELADLLTDRQRATLAAFVHAMVWPHGVPAGEPVISREAGKIIESARVAAGLSVRDVTADVVEVSARDWKRIVAGERGADPRTWVDMATAAGATDRLNELTDLLGFAPNDIG